MLYKDPAKRLAYQERQRAKARAYYWAHREEVLAAKAAKRVPHSQLSPAQLKATRARARENYRKRRVKIAAWRAAHYRKNRDRILAQKRVQAARYRRARHPKPPRVLRGRDPAKLKAAKARHYQRHKNEILAKQKAARSSRSEAECERLRARHRAYNLNNRERIRAKRREWARSHPDKRRRPTATVAHIKAKYRAKNREKLRAAGKLYAQRTKRQKAARGHIYTRQPKVKLVRRLRARLSFVRLKLKLKCSKGHTLELLGCRISDFARHLELQFQPGMSWEEIHLWHIDHIRPVSSFDLTDPAERSRAFHFTNLQPLWAQENLIKGARWNDSS